jgi:hypothetical protein
MRLALWCGVVLCGVAIKGATAQNAMGVQQTSIGQNQSIMAAILEPVNGAPYQAEKVSRSVQTLSDGTVITHESKGMIARDAQGRVREDIYQTHSGEVNGREMDHALQSATVGDPVAHTMLLWTGEKSKVAMQMQLPSLPRSPMTAMLSSPPPPPPPPPGSVMAGVSLGTRGKTVAAGGTSGDGSTLMVNQVRTEELGRQSIEGVLVSGKRITTTIPTGKVGNDRPIVVVHEEWRSPELKILVKTIDTDPRTGEQTMELQGLVRTDPDAALFQVPAGYQVKDMAAMMKGLGEMGKPKAQ